MYARSHNVPEQDVVAVSGLAYDSNTKLLVAGLICLPPGIQKSESTLKYLKEISADGRITDAERIRMDLACRTAKLDLSRDLQDIAVECVLFNKSPHLAKSYDYLSSISDRAVMRMTALGIDENVTDYISFISTLDNRDLVKYALENALCIKDRMLTSVERKFFQDPDLYFPDLYNSYLSQITAIDPELVSKLKQLPYLKGKPELKTMSSLENIFGLALNPKGKSVLETIYGKGIQRKLWSVALERLFYKCFEKDFDSNDLSVDQDIQICIKLAHFQEKYNKEMDQDGIPGPKPTIIGMNYFHEPHYYLPKKDQDYIYDYSLIKWVLRCNAVKIWGYDANVFKHATLAQNEDLDVWAEFSPLWTYPSMSVSEYKSKLIDFTKKAEENNIKFIYVGCENDIWWNTIGGSMANYIKSPDFRESNKLSNLLNELVGEVKQNYSGKVTYADWWASHWKLKDIDWTSMDIVSINIYKQDNASDEEYYNSILNMNNKHAKPFNKPFIVSETGSLTISEAEIKGGNDTNISNCHYDPENQFRVINKELNLVFQAGADGVFASMWDAPVNYSWGMDMNKYGFGVWDYVQQEPKLGFWAFYKYFK